MEKTLYAQLFKVEESTRLITGIASEELPDRADEILDYFGSKQYFQEWTANAEKISGGKSKGNLRRAHSLQAVGKLTAIDFDDTNKRISITAKVTDDQTWSDILDGVLTSYSIGGSYVSKKKAGDFTKYICRPSEVSVCDLGCLPSATFQVVKADGTVLQKHFRSGNTLELRPGWWRNDWIEDSGCGWPKGK